MPVIVLPPAGFACDIYGCLRTNFQTAKPQLGSLSHVSISAGCGLE